MLASPDSVTVASGVAVPMRDGTLLRADVYHPARPGRFPALVRRTPYRREGWAGYARQLASRGYLVVVQDLRGRGGSDGTFTWSFAEAAQTVEAEDGYDTVEWAGAHERSNGRVGTWGHSYDAWAALRLAAVQPPSLGALHVTGMSPRMLDPTRGILDLGRRMEWCYALGADISGRRDGRGGLVEDDAAVLSRWRDHERGKWLWYLPLADLPPDALFGLTGPFTEFLRDVDRELWAFDRDHPRIDVPACFVTGWWDRFNGTIDNYTGMAAHGPERLRGAHRLVVGPWSHSPTTFTSRLGAFDHGPAAEESYVDLIARWYDHALKDVDNGIADEPPIRIFVVGRNEWRFEHEWPPARARERVLYLHSRGNAATPSGDGALGPEEPAAEPPDRYEYDPRDPVMSIMLPDAHLAPCDQAVNDHRTDKLCYTGDPLAEELEITGEPEVRLWAATDGLDTDWVARLIVVRPDGSAIDLVSGIVRARYRDGCETPSLLQPGEPCEYRIPLGPISIVLPPGHRLRLDVTSSDFPNFDRNHNTGADFATDPRLRRAAQQILHDAEHPSRLVLPVLRSRS